MRTMSVALLTACLLAGGSTVALAQSGYDGNQGERRIQNQANGAQGLNQPGVHRNWIPGPLSPAAENEPDNPSRYNRAWPAGPLAPAAAENQYDQGQSHGQSRFDQRRILRRELRQAGFQNIRILDAMFLVQARTPSGQPVTMVLSPSEEDNLTTSSFPEADRTMSNRSRSNQGQ